MVVVRVEEADATGYPQHPPPPPPPRASLIPLNLAITGYILTLEAPQSSATCKTCRHMVDKITSVVDNKVVEKAIEKTVKDAVCPTLGTMELACDLLVPKLVPEVIDEVVDVVNNVGCAPFCGKGVQHPFEASDSALCGLCEAAVIKAHDEVTSKSFQADLSSIAGRLCDQAGSATTKAECQAIVAIALPAAEKKLVDFLADESAACSSAGLCA